MPRLVPANHREISYYNSTYGLRPSHYSPLRMETGLTPTSHVLELGEQNAAELKRLAARVATSSSVSTVQRTPQSTSRSPWPASRRVSFADGQQRRTRPVQYQQSRQQAPRIFGQRQPSRFSFRGNACDPSATSACLNCGSWHAVRPRFCRA